MEVENREADYGKGFVYVLQDPTNSGIFKVGITNRSVRVRANELYQSSGVPLPFEIKKIFEIDSRFCLAVERTAHLTLKQKGFHHGKEWFNCTLKDCVHAIEDAIYELTDEKAVDLIGQAEQRRQEEEKKRQAKLQWETLVSNHLEKTNEDITNLREKYAQSLAENKKFSVSDALVYLFASLFFFGLAVAFFSDKEMIASFLFTCAGIYVIRKMKSEEQEEFYKLASDKYPYKTKQEIENTLLTKNSKDSAQASDEKVNKANAHEKVVSGSLSKTSNTPKPEILQEKRHETSSSYTQKKQNAVIVDKFNSKDELINQRFAPIENSKSIHDESIVQLSEKNSTKDWKSCSTTKGQNASTLDCYSGPSNKKKTESKFNDSLEVSRQDFTGEIVGEDELENRIGFALLINIETQRFLLVSSKDLKQAVSRIGNLLRKDIYRNELLQSDFNKFGPRSFYIDEVNYFETLALTYKHEKNTLIHLCRCKVKLYEPDSAIDLSTLSGEELVEACHKVKPLPKNSRSKTKIETRKSQPKIQNPKNSQLKKNTRRATGSSKFDESKYLRKVEKECRICLRIYESLDVNPSNCTHCGAVNFR